MSKLFKAIKQEVTDLDEKTMTIKGYFAAFGNKDSYNDIIVPGAFTKTILENGPQGKDMIYHFKNHWDEVAKPSELFQDAYGLGFVTPLPKSTKGMDTMEEFRYGLWKYFSIGYSTVKEEQRQGYQDLLELKLFEGSHVLWPANENAILTDVDWKGLDELNAFRAMTKNRELIAVYENMLSKSKATDERLRAMEAQLAELKSTTQPPSTVPDLQLYGNVLDNFLI